MIPSRTSDVKQKCGSSSNRDLIRHFMSHDRPHSKWPRTHLTHTSAQARPLALLTYIKNPQSS